MKKYPLTSTLGMLATLSAALTACGGGGSSGDPARMPSQDPTGSGVVQKEPTSIPRGTRTFKTDFLLFNGNGTWGPEVSSLKNLFSERGASFDVADQSDLNAMSLDELESYGAIVWPGGLGTTQMSGLTSATKIKLRRAVQEKGVGWIGFCAGSFVAVAPPPPEGENPSYGLGIVAGPVLEYYYLENELHAAGKSDFTIVTHSLPNGQERDLVWYGGPVTPETQAGVIARYPNGQPSISQTWSGNGFVILSAVHPAAPQSVRDSFLVTDSDGTDFELAWQMLDGVLKQKELPTL